MSLCVKKITEKCIDLNNPIQGIFSKKRLLTTILCSFIFLGKLLVEAELRENPGCKIVKAADVIIGDCYEKGFSEGIPQDLVHNLKVLNLSRNNIYNITNHSFVRYKDHLTTLDLSYLPQWDDYLILEKGTFHPLSKLEYLDMTNSCWSHKFTLPSNIRILKIENCSTFLDLAHLKNLEEFHAAGNNWSEAPRFHTLAPLKYVDLRRNALNYFAIENVAPFCELKAMFLDGFPSREIIRKNAHNDSIYCLCRTLDSWLTNNGVKHRQLECLPPLESVPICTSKPSDEAFRLRRTCLARIASKTITSVKTNWWLIAAAVIILGVLLISTIIVTRRRFRRTQKKHTQDDEEDDDDDDEDEEDD